MPLPLLLPEVEMVTTTVEPVEVGEDPDPAEVVPVVEEEGEEEEGEEEGEAGEEAEGAMEETTMEVTGRPEVSHAFVNSVGFV